MENTTETSDNTGKVIAAFVVGALAGAALGVLFAPHKGSKTRRKLMAGAQGLAEDVKKKMTEEATSLRAKADELESIAKEKISTITTAVQQQADTFKNHS